MSDLDPLLALLAHMDPGPMRDALTERAQHDPAFVEELLLDFFAAGPEARADIAAFFDSGGPEVVERLRQDAWREHDGTPTAEDLGGWINPTNNEET